MREEEVEDDRSNVVEFTHADQGDQKPKRAPRLPKTLHPSDLQFFHMNPRVGDVDEIVKSLRKHGQYKPLTVNLGTHTGRANEVLAGNHTLKAIRKLLEGSDDPKWRKVLVHFVDVDDETANSIVAADNKLADRGKYADDILADLLSNIPDLEGTGYDTKDLEKLLGQEIVDGDAPIDDQPVAYGVVVDCDSEAQQVSLLEKLEAEGFQVRALM